MSTCYPQACPQNPGISGCRRRRLSPLHFACRGRILFAINDIAGMPTSYPQACSQNQGISRHRKGCLYGFSRRVQRENHVFNQTLKSDANILSTRLPTKSVDKFTPARHLRRRFFHVESNPTIFREINEIDRMPTSYPQACQQNPGIT